MSTREVDVLLSKVQGIQKLLGGPQKEHGRLLKFPFLIFFLAKQEVDEFTKIKQAIAEIINTISKTQDERDAKLDKTGRDVGVIKLGADIRDLLNDADNHLAQMSKTLDRQKRNPKVEILKEECV